MSIGLISLPPNKRRPVLIITRDSLIRHLNEVTVVPITTTVRGVPSEIALDSEDGMFTFCAVNFLHIQTIQKRLLTERITTLSNEKLDLVKNALNYAFDVD